MTPHDAPLTPGSVWRSRGTAGHDRYEVRLLRLTAAGRVTFVRVTHRQGRGERRTTVNEPVFRQQYEPVKVEPVSDAQAAAHQLDALRLRERQHRAQAARTNGALVDRLGLDAEELIASAPASPVAAEGARVCRKQSAGPDAAEAEALSVGPLPAPDPAPAVAVPVLESYLDAGLAALQLLDGQLAAKGAAIAARSPPSRRSSWPSGRPSPPRWRRSASRPLWPNLDNW